MVEPFPRRGEVWICGLGPSAGRRPVAIVSSDELNAVRRKVIVAVGTRTVRAMPTEVPIGPEEGLVGAGVLSGGDLLTVEHGMLLRRTGRLSAGKFRALQEALRLVFEL